MKTFMSVMLYYNQLIETHFLKIKDLLLCSSIREHHILPCLGTPLLGLLVAGGDREKGEKRVSPTGWGCYFSRGGYIECHEEFKKKTKKTVSNQPDIFKI